MTHARRDEDCPRPQVPHVESVHFSKGRRTVAQVAQDHLEHPGNRHPQIGLFKVVMDGLDRLRISLRCGYLNARAATWKHSFSDPRRSKPRQLAKIATIIRIQPQRLNAHSGDQHRGFRRQNDVPNALSLARRHCQLQPVLPSDPLDFLIHLLLSSPYHFIFHEGHLPALPAISRNRPPAYSLPRLSPARPSPYSFAVPGPGSARPTAHTIHPLTKPGAHSSPLRQFP